VSLCEGKEKLEDEYTEPGKEDGAKRSGYLEMEEYTHRQEVDTVL
jgi:hypothetical protein